jgi:hypothetical protein
MKEFLSLSCLVVLVGGIPARGAPLIINEFSAVGDGVVLENSGKDTFFDAHYINPTGNGGNWVELVVTQDHLDLRGWKVEWSNTDPDSGNVVFTNNSLWSDVRSGAIITLRENDTGVPGNPVGARVSNVSFNPAGGDFWLEINVGDPLYIISSSFKVDNDNWRGTIRDNLNNIVQGPVGESLTGAGQPWQGGGGINSQEVGQLKINPTAGSTAASYTDADWSSYGAANWLNSNGSVVQDFSNLRLWVPEPNSLVLAALAACGAAAVVWRRRFSR